MRRVLLTGFAIALTLIGLFLVLEPIVRPAAPPPPREVLVAADSVDTYEVVSTEVVTREAAEIPPNAWVGLPPGVVLVSKQPIQRGATLSYQNTAQVGSEWRPATMDYEILSFPASFDKMVAGQIRSGHRINLYGYHQDEEVEKPPVTLIAGNVWVVDARSARGVQPQEPTPTPVREGDDGRPADADGGLFSGGAVAADTIPASIVTVAAEPEVIWRIVDALGAQAYQAWVTLAGTQRPVTPTPVPTPTSTPTPPPTVTPETVTETVPITVTRPATATDVINVVLLDWFLDIVAPRPEELGLIPTTKDGYTFDYYGRELTFEIMNNTERRLWAERWDQDNRATVLIDGQEGQRVWYQPGEGGVIQIELIEGARQATVVLMDADEIDECFGATYVEDVTIPDNTQMDPKAVFSKTWQLRNTGTCEWPRDTELALLRGDRLGAMESVTVGSVAPGDSVDVSVAMQAPAASGRYRGIWQIRAGNRFFGSRFWVAIQVGSAEEVTDDQ